jgi:hypothetical protein
LLFRQNNKNVGVRNGDLGTVRKVHKDQLKIQLDSGELLTVPKTYQSIDYGYALTVHKSQGMTTEHAKVLIDNNYWDRHLSFVAMTRHKQSLSIYADKINHPELRDLKRTLNRSITNDNVIDWPLNFAIRTGFNPDKLIRNVVNHIAGTGHKIKECFNYMRNYDDYLHSSEQKPRYNENKIFHAAAKEAANCLDTHYQNRIHEAIKAEFPLFAQYDSFSKKHPYITGYYREKFDKSKQVIEQQLESDKKFMAKIATASPEVAIQLRQRAKFDFHRGIVHDC